MADEPIVGGGPGAEHVEPRWIGALALYLVVLTVAPVCGLMWLWPSCEVPSDPVHASAGLGVIAISPGSGSTAGGDTVTIRGTGFTQETTVTFGAEKAQVIVVGPRSLRASTPKHKPGRVDVIVTNPDKRRDALFGGFIFVDTTTPLPKPSLASLTPAAGPISGDRIVTITGAGFSGVTTVTFGGIPATQVHVINDTALTATTPAHAEGKVDVVVGNESSSATLTNAYTYTCWGAMPNLLLTMVAFAGALGGALHGLRSLFWYVGNRDLRKSWVLMYVLQPVSGAAIAIIFYLVASAGLITIQGTGTYLLIGLAALVGMFSPQASEKLKKIAEGLLTNAPQGENTVPPKPPSAAGEAPALAVKSIAPPSGSAAGGTSVTVTGTGFASGATVTLGGTPASAVRVTPTSITATTPSHATGQVDVAVTNPNRQSHTLPGGYLYTAPPVAPPPQPRITSLTPTSGPSTGAQPVTIAGRGFLGVTSVKFGGIPAPSLRVSDDATIIVTPPNHPAGAVDVVVGEGTTAATLPSGYTFT